MPYSDPEKKREYDKRRYWENRDEQIALSKAYYHAHREDRLRKIKASVDPEAKAVYDREYGQREHVRARRAVQRREWTKANPDKAFAANKASSHRRRGVRPDKEAREYMSILSHDPCAYCGGIREHIDHIVPIKAGGDSRWDNLTAACQRCNYGKRDKSLLTFLSAGHY